MKAVGTKRLLSILFVLTVMAVRTPLISLAAPEGWPTIESSGLVRAGLGCEFQYAVVAYNDPESYAAKGLPAGLALDTQTGVIAGVPIELGEFAVSLVASNRHGRGIGSLTIRVSPVVAWGSNYDGQTDVPAGLSNVVVVAAGGVDSFALRGDGTVSAWGGNFQGGASLSSGLTNVAAIAASDIRGSWSRVGRALALRNDGTVVAWDANWNGQSNVPAELTNVVDVDVGYDHSLALRADGTVVAWGASHQGQADVPAGLTNAVAVAAGATHSLALRADGTVVAWGTIWNGSRVVPMATPAALRTVVAIAAGAYHSLALRADGTVLAWGAGTTNTVSYPNYGQSIVPASLSNVVALAAGDFYSVALRADGTVVVWGGETNVTNVPSGLRNVAAIAAGGGHILALLGARTPFLTTRLVDRQTFMGGSVYWRAAAGGGWPLTYQWQFEGTDLPRATNAVLELTDVQADQAGSYSVRVTGPFGTVTSPPAHLRLAPILVDSQPVDQVTYVGGTATFSVAVRTSVPVNFQWQFNGTDLPGATNATLALSHVRLDQAGAYSVRASNVFGEVTSVEAELHVNEVVACSGDYFGSVSVPPGLTGIVAVATGSYPEINAALRADGTVVAWGVAWGGESGVPARLTNVVGIAAAGEHSLALLANGTIVAWGAYYRNDGALVFVPAGLTNVVAMAAGRVHDLALLADGTVVAWGVTLTSPNSWHDFGQFRVPAGLSRVVAVAAGTAHSLALRADGRVVAWGAGGHGMSGYPHFGQSAVPRGLSNVMAIAAGEVHSLALKSDGKVIAWGFNGQGQTDVPMDLSNVVAIATGENHSLALKADGTVVAWGDAANASVPAGLANVNALASGFTHWLALIGDGPPVVKAPLRVPTVLAGAFSVSVPTQSGRVYALEYSDSLTDATWTPLPLVAGTGHERTLTDPIASATQRFYRLRRW